MDMSTILRGKKEAKGEVSGYEIMYYEPKVYEDSLNISTHLRSGSPVVINLKHLDPSEGTRLVDFVCGTAYAIDGHMMKIGESIFLFTPNHIAITSAEERTSLGEEIAFEQEKRETFFSR
jgi:FtsZ-interacting cell division protein YlmF